MKDKAKYLIILLTVCINSITSFAQPGDKREKLEALKRQFLSTELNLTVSEAEKFWPVFNEFEAQRKSIRQSIRKAESVSEKAEVSEKELNDALNTIQQKKKEEIDAEVQFVRNTMPIIGTVKASKLLSLEEEFRRRIMEEVRERREGQRPPAGGGRR